MRLMHLRSTARACHTIDIAIAYVIPDDRSLEMLVAAQQRGVRVRILYPG